MRVLGIVGSLRRESYNRALMRLAQELVPEGMRIEVWEGLRSIPPYDQDQDAAGAPEPVLALKRAIAEADALLVATPEYNYSVPGVLKNAIDWASRPNATSPLNGKPAAIMGASGGMGGTIRAQMALRQVFLNTNTLVVPRPQVTVANCTTRMDAEGRFVDPTTRDWVRQLLVALQAWAARFR